MKTKISQLPEHEFTSDDIDNCFYVEDMNQPTMKVVRMQSVFDWIKDEANKNGLTVKMTDERIMFIIGIATSNGLNMNFKNYDNADIH